MRLRPLASGLGAGLLAVAVLSVVPSPATADFATDCSAPSRTLSGGGKESFSVQDGETLLLTGGSFTGGVDAFPAGSTLCVASSATLRPAYLNNAAGALVVAAGGEVYLKGVALATGFSLENEGTFTGQNLNVNGAATLYNAPGATFETTGGFSPAAGAFVNDGTMRFNGGADLNTSVSLQNTRLLRVNGGLDVNGGLENTGVTRVTGKLTVNGSGTLDNKCALVVGGDLANNGPVSSNEGVTYVGSRFTNNGSWQQTQTGVLRAAELSNDGSVDGFGRYLFPGTTASQGSFTGDSAADPIVVEDRTPPAPPQIFDTQSGTVTNVVAGTVPAPSRTDYPLPGCSADFPPSQPSADVEASKSAPAQVEAGGAITFTITVTNHGPDPATDVVVTDTLPANLVGPATASDGGDVSGDTVTWDLGDLAAEETRTLTVSGTAPDDGTLVNNVRSDSSTPDPTPTNNDGSAEPATSVTEVETPDPVNNPPVAPDLSDTTVSRVAVAGVATASDPDAGQQLRYAVVGAPSNGRTVMLAGGGVAYYPDAGFTGVDSYEYQVCDNGSPSLCDTATITVTVFPVARPDSATTYEDVPVVIPARANDTGDAPLVSTADGPANGSVTFEADGTITYTPDPGFVGTDTFTYTICSPTAPDVCASAPVTVTVLPVNHPPTLPDELFTTDVNHRAQGRAEGSDPDGDDLSYARAARPRHGKVEVTRGGRLVYVPKRGYAGHDSFRVTVCDDGDPVLCATGRVRVDVYPEANFDSATTTEGKPVLIRSASNDLGRHRAVQAIRDPRHGTVRAEGGAFLYRPDAGFTGRDFFRYRLCTPGARPLCDTAWVRVTVTAVDPDDGGGGDGGGGGGGGGIPS